MNRRTATVFVDLLMLLLLILIILPHKPRLEAKPAVELFSQLMIGVRWPDNTPADVDLWVRAPGDLPVGYSNTRGSASSLVWDDVGSVDNPSWRYEAVMLRSATDGENTVNLHCYKCLEPINTTVSVWKNLPDGVRELWRGAVGLVPSQEITVIRFSVKDGQIIPGSFHDSFVTLRSGKP